MQELCTLVISVRVLLALQAMASNDIIAVQHKVVQWAGKRALAASSLSRGLRVGGLTSYVVKHGSLLTLFCCRCTVVLFPAG
jgi:hypothetical protein